MMEINTEILQMRRALLHDALIQLKKEFVGIDYVIDEVLNNITPWYLFPYLQERPTIINLWGLTGVGKSSLVNRLIHLLDFENKYFRFDLGETFDREYSVKKKLANLFPTNSGIPMILAFDEFQHARTLDDVGGELDKGFIRSIWEILDSGKFTINHYSRHQASLSQLISMLTFMLGQGVVVKQGKVIERQRYFYSTLNERGMAYQQSTKLSKGKSKPEDHFFVSSIYMDELLDLSLGRFKSELDVKATIDTMDGPQTVKLLQEIYDRSLAPQTVDCSQSIVFIMGNLDEAYSMSHDLNPDISADAFHEQSLKINISTIKNALAKRFRQEQIGRLGNCHIIYPAFSKASFEAIIQLELTKIQNKVKELGIELHFDKSIISVIYSEGVFPTQGVRPLYTTIHQIIGSRLGKIISEQILSKENASIHISWSRPDLVIDFISENQPLRTQRYTLILSLGKLRESTHDDMQAITAVHEAGHAILSMVLLKVLPQVVQSVSADDDSAGFVYSKVPWKYISRKEIPSRIAVMLGGLAAEEVVFGKDRVTTGASSDLCKATKFINHLIMESGLGDSLGYFQYETKASLHHLVADERHQGQAEKWLEEAYLLALNTLKTQQSWLIHLADFLSDNSLAGPEQLKQMALVYASQFDVDKLVQSDTQLYYRAQLKSLVNSVNNEMPAFWHESALSLNRINSPAA